MTEENMRENILTTRSTALVSTPGKMAVFTRDTGTKVSNMEMEYTIKQMVKNVVDAGNKESVCNGT